MEGLLADRLVSLVLIVAGAATVVRSFRIAGLTNLTGSISCAIDLTDLRNRQAANMRSLLENAAWMVA
jgi:hypothetical protein